MVTIDNINENLSIAILTFAASETTKIK